MVDFFIDVHIALRRTVIYLASRDSSFLLFIARVIVTFDQLWKVIANVYLSIYFRFIPSKKLNCDVHRVSPKLVVTLTTFPLRIDKLWLVLECMLRQSIVPDEIHLWLSKDQFPNSIPKSIIRLIKKNVQVHYVDGDIRSHKKYYYVFKTNPNDNIVTIDDDILYRSDFLETLLRYSSKYPKCVITNYARKMEYDETGLLSHNLWKQYDGELTDKYVFFGSGGGTLFPPGSLHEEVLNIDSAWACCPTADDVWLNAMARLNGTRIIKTDYSVLLFPIVRWKDIALSANENEGDGNDLQIKKIRQYCIEKYSNDPFDVHKIIK